MTYLLVVICLFWRLPTSSLCDSPSCGFLYELRIHFPRWGFCPRNLSSACSSFTCRKPGASWEAIPHSLQPAAALWTRPNEPGTSTDIIFFSAAPRILTSSGNSTVCKPVTSPGSGPAAAATIPYKSCAGLREEPSTSLWVPAGELWAEMCLRDSSRHQVWTRSDCGAKYTFLISGSTRSDMNSQSTTERQITEWKMYNREWERKDDKAGAWGWETVKIAQEPISTCLWGNALFKLLEAIPTTSFRSAVASLLIIKPTVFLPLVLIECNFSL